MNLANLEEILRVQFKNKELLKEALIHRSYVNDNRSANLTSYERLEYLGDALLYFVITDYLYSFFPDFDEGQLTVTRSKLINTESCARVAQKLGLTEYIHVSKGILRDGARSMLNINADVTEAVIGAIYLDAGFDKAREFIVEHFGSMVKDILATAADTDPKTSFQNRAQKEYRITPRYETLYDSGDTLNPAFEVAAYIENEMVAKGKGKSKQEAEQEAARASIKAKGW